MSRTIRRQNATHLRPLSVDLIDRWDLRQYGTTDPKVCLARMKADFHGDNHVGSYNPPSWYSRFRNKKIDRSSKQALHHCQRNGDWDAHLPEVFLKDAGYNWW